MATSYYINDPAVATAIAPIVTALLTLVTSNAKSMVITRQKIATAEANTSVKTFRKKQNGLKTKEPQEYAANNAASQYDLNLHVLCSNDYSTFAEMIKGYCSMARRFHPDNNYGFDTTEMMKMINTATEGLQDQLC